MGNRAREGAERWLCAPADHTINGPEGSIGRPIGRHGDPFGLLPGGGGILRGAVPGLRAIAPRRGVLGLGALLAACGVPAPAGGEGPVLSVVASHPAPGGLLEDGRTVDLCFDGLLDPRTVDPSDFLLASGRIVVDSDVAVQIRPWYGPGGTLPGAEPWCPGSVVSVRPRAGLAGGVRMRLRMRPDAVGWSGEAIAPEGPGFFEDAEGERMFTLEFETAQAQDGERLDPWSPPAPAPTLVELFEPGRVFGPDGGCGCHVAGDPSTDPTALARLDLSSPRAAFEDLLTPPGDLSEAFPVVAPGDPSGSFLVHKLLRTEGGLAIRGVRGVPMPPAGPLPFEDLVDLARWIEGGAAF